jgi:hypothetical protein
MKTTLMDELHRPQSGIHTDAGRLAGAEAALALVLQTAKGLAGKSGLPADWDANWRREWEHVEVTLDRIRGFLGDMDAFLEHEDNDSLRRAMDVWKTIQSLDVDLNTALDRIRADTRALAPDARREWSEVDEALTTQLEAIHARALAFRVKLELMKDYTKSEVSHLLEGMLSKLPNRGASDTMDAEAYAQQYRQTIHELDEERHQFGGFMDFIKGLAMWVETPHERMKKKSLHAGGHP